MSVPPPSSPARRLRRFVALVVASALAGAALSASSGAQESDRLIDRLPEIDPADGAQIEAALGAVGMDAAWRSAAGLNPISRAMVVDYRAGDEDAVVALLVLAARIEATRGQQADVSERLRTAAVHHTEAVEIERLRLIDRNRAEAHLIGTEALLKSVAIDLFAGNGDAADELLGSDGQALLRAQRTHELQGHTLDEMLDRRDRALQALALAEERLADARVVLADAAGDHDRLSDESIAILQALRGLEDEAREAIPEAANAFALAAVPREPNLTVRALDAYINAEQAWTELAPRCRVSWRSIAAIGAVEGAHAQYDGREIQLDGRPDRPIIGLALDGLGVDNYGETLAAIADTDGGRWDGDTEYDRAVGPMQFIPETWARWAHDGDADGVFDPQDLDDAAVAAGGYLCNYGSHRDWEVWKAAVFGYNHSAHYVASVKSALDRLQRVRLPELEGVELRPSRPWGEYVPMPIPEPEPDPADLASADG